MGAPTRSEIFGTANGGALSGRGDEPEVDWPVKSDQVVYRTNDGRSPVISKVRKAENAREQWQQCWRLGQVDNLYDLGFTRNVADVLFS